MEAYQTISSQLIADILLAGNQSLDLGTGAFACGAIISDGDSAFTGDVRIINDGASGLHLVGKGTSGPHGGRDPGWVAFYGDGSAIEGYMWGTSVDGLLNIGLSEPAASDTSGTIRFVPSTGAVTFANGDFEIDGNGHITNVGNITSDGFILADFKPNFNSDWAVPYYHKPSGILIEAAAFTFNGSILLAPAMTATGTIQALQLTSTDDITMQGHLLTLGATGTDTDIILRFLGSTNSANLTYEPDVDRFDFADAAILTTGTLGSGAITVTANNDITLSGTGHVTSGSEGFIVGSVTIIDGLINNVGSALRINFDGTNDYMIGNSTSIAFYRDNFNAFQITDAGNLTLNIVGRPSGGKITAYNKTGTNNAVQIAYDAYLTVSNASGATGLGIRYRFLSENDAGAQHILGAFDYVWTDAAAGAEHSAFNVYTYNAGTETLSFTARSNYAAVPGALRVGDTVVPTDALEVNGVTVLGDGGTDHYTQFAANGSITQVGDAIATLLQLKVVNDVGFYNTPPVAQNQLATGAGKTVDNIITEIQRLGLVRQAA